MESEQWEVERNGCGGGADRQSRIAIEFMGFINLYSGNIT